MSCILTKTRFRHFDAAGGFAGAVCPHAEDEAIYDRNSSCSPPADQDPVCDRRYQDDRCHARPAGARV